jgi:hypothetical protein
MINWLLQPGTSHMELLMKQLSVSVPFVINYPLLGNVSKIAAFISSNGLAAALNRFPGEAENVLFTGSLTTILQTLFYSFVMNRGVGGWINSQQGNEKSELARPASHLIKTPILAFDAYALMQASRNAHPLAHLGSLSFNTGHIELAALTLMGAILILKPALMDPAIPAYRYIIKNVKRLRKKKSAEAE